VQIPPLFYPMLNKCLAIPLLEAWSDYLWASGQEEKLLTLLNAGEGQGYAAWRACRRQRRGRGWYKGGWQAGQSGSNQRQSHSG